MTRILAKKIVVPKDYATLGRAASTGESLSLTGETCVINVEINERPPFDMVYEELHSFLQSSAKLTSLPSDRDTITYKIICNIRNNKNYRFIRFIFYPDVDFTYAISNDIVKLDQHIPCLKVTCNIIHQNSSITAPVVVKGNSISIDFNRIDNKNFKTNENGYSIIYDTLTNEIYDDTENGTELWDEVQTRPANDDVMAAEINDTISSGSGIGNIPSSIKEQFLGSQINKAIAPIDFAKLIHTVQNTSSITSLTAGVHDLTFIDVIDLPNYDMVGEIKCVYPMGSGDQVMNVELKNSYITTLFKLSSELANKYRYIRFYVQPNINNIISISTADVKKLYYKVSCVFDGVDTYSSDGKFISDVSNGLNLSTEGDVYAFIFDTKTKKFIAEDTNFAGLWSDRNFIMNEYNPANPVA